MRIAIALCLVLSLSSCDFIKRVVYKPEACEAVYETSFYVALCNVDVTLTAAAREVNRQIALGVPAESLVHWTTKIGDARTKIDMAEVVYRTEGLDTITSDQVFIRLIDELEKWVVTQSGN